MAIKLFGCSITSVYKSVVSTVSKNVSKSSSANSKSSSSWNKTSGSSKSSSSGNKASGSSSNKTSSSGNKVSATATSKVVSSNVSKQSTTTKYVKDAAAIYNASGKKVSTPSSISTGRPAQSYTTQKKVGSASSQKTSGNASSVKTTNAKVKTVTTTSSKSTYSKSSLSVSTGRPDQSYATQKKASTAYNQKTSGNSSKQAKLPVPVAPKAPVVKKDPSEASYSNNRPKQSYTHVVAYKPSPSREGAGQMFYMNKTNTKALKAGASFATSCIPYVGDAKDIQEAITGKDLITGEKLTGSDRVLTIASAGLPFVTGPMLKSAKNGGKIAVEKAPDVVKGAEKLLKKNAPKVKKAVNKTDVAEDTAKVMKKKAVEKAKDAGKTKETVKVVEELKSGSKPGKPYVKSRPSFRKNQVEDVWENAKDTSTGKIYDPSGIEITWDKNEPRKGQWDMGHIPGEKYSEMHKLYMDDIISKDEFLKWYKDSKNYRPELPSTNRSHKYE